MTVNLSLKKVLVVIIGVFFCYGLLQNFIPNKAYANGGLIEKLRAACKKDCDKAVKQCAKRLFKVLKSKKYKDDEEARFAALDKHRACVKEAHKEFDKCDDVENLKVKKYRIINKKVLAKIEKASDRCTKEYSGYIKACDKLKKGRSDCINGARHSWSKCHRGVDKKYKSALIEPGTPEWNEQ
jgi:hypothetical protein